MVVCQGQSENKSSQKQIFFSGGESVQYHQVQKNNQEKVIQRKNFNYFTVKPIQVCKSKGKYRNQRGHFIPGRPVYEKIEENQRDN